MRSREGKYLRISPLLPLPDDNRTMRLREMSLDERHTN